MVPKSAKERYGTGSIMVSACFTTTERCKNRTSWHLVRKEISNKGYCQRDNSIHYF